MPTAQSRTEKAGDTTRLVHENSLTKTPQANYKKKKKKVAINQSNETNRCGRPANEFPKMANSLERNHAP